MAIAQSEGVKRARMITGPPWWKSNGFADSRPRGSVRKRYRPRQSARLVGAARAEYGPAMQNARAKCLNSWGSGSPDGDFAFQAPHDGYVAASHMPSRVRTSD